MTARVLVVDDISANLRLLEAKLLNEYYEVSLAASGPEALATVQRWMPDVVLLDVMMPGMDGYEVCRRLKAQPSTAHIPVVMVTALTDAVERVRGLEAGADDFLSKPVDDATLFARLRALLRMKQVLDAWRLRAETARDLGFEAPPGPSPSVAGARALIINESAVEAEQLTAVLGYDGIEVSVSADSTEALDLLVDGAFDVVLLSLSLDGGDALRLASRLRARVRNQIRRKRYQERLRADLDRSLEMAVTDPLTGLRNRRYVRRHLEGVLRNSGAAVLMIDVDRFKAVNDTYGHASGDVVLREVAERVRGHLRAADVVARYGGEEFLVVMSAATVDDGMLVAERLRNAIATVAVHADGHELRITASVGVAAGGIGAQSDDVVGAADTALYRAKNNGRNRVEPATDEDWSPNAGRGKAPRGRSGRE